MSNDRQLKYTQKWTNNMLNKCDYHIEPGYKGESYIQVKYVMDFERFGYQDRYPDEALALFAAHGADLSLSCKIPVIFNQTKLDCQDIKKYTKWLHGNQVTNSIIHIEKGEGIVPDIELLCN